MPSASARSPPSTAGTSPLWSSSAPDVAVTSAPGSISTAYRTATSCAARWCTGSQPGAQRCYFFAPAWGYGLTDRSCASQALSICREAHYRLSLRDTPSAWHGVALRPRTTLLVGQPPPQSHPPPETGTNPRQPRPLVARKIGADSGPSEANAQVRRGHRHSPLGASPSRTATRIASTRVWCQPIAQYESVASAHSWPAFAHLRCPVTAPAVLVGEVSPRSPPPRETVCE